MGFIMPHLDLSKLDKSYGKDLEYAFFPNKLHLFISAAQFPLLFVFPDISPMPLSLFFSFLHSFPLSCIQSHQSLLPFLVGERVLASGSVQLPRFTLLESGSLLISPSHLSDAGTYTCMASNSRGIDEASADLVVWGKG